MMRRTKRAFVIVSVALTACAQIAGIKEGELVTPEDGDGAVDTQKPDVVTRGDDDDASDERPDAGQVDDDGGDPEETPDADAGVVTTADADAGPTNPCLGKPDGTRITSLPPPTNECCGGKVVSLQSNDHCAVCGIKCGGGGSCKELPDSPGRYACTCTADATCKSTGYGTSGSCYAGNTGKLFCQCQCSGSGDCDGQCTTGGRCANIPNGVINYCYYK